MHTAFILIFVILLAFVSPNSQASTGSGITPFEFSKKVGSAQKWKDLIHLVEDSLPKNVMKDISARADQATFPDIVFRNSIVYLKDPNGGRLEIKFGEEGSIFFGDKEWVLRPLTSLTEEVARIEKYLTENKGRHTSIFDSLFPSAVASPGSGGIALAAYTAAAGWQADSCGGSKLSERQNSTCPLTAVAMRTPTLQEQKALLPTVLKCPDPMDDGILELISNNQRGEATKLDVTFESGEATIVEIYTADKDSPFELYQRIVLQTETRPTRISSGKENAGRATSLKESVCDGGTQTPAYKKYMATLAANKESLRKAAQDNPQPDDAAHHQRAI